MHTRTRNKHMNQAEAKIRIDELKAVLWENSRRYYVDNAPTMSDYDYDLLMKELEALEAEFNRFNQLFRRTRRIPAKAKAKTKRETETTTESETKESAQP